MLENLNIGPEYDGFLFLAESVRNPPVLRPHHHVELEFNLVVSGDVTYVFKGRRYRFPKRSLFWFFPAQEHQLVDRTPDAGYWVAVFKPEMLENACRSKRYAVLKQQQISDKGILHTELEPDVHTSLCATMDALVKDGPDPDLINREAGFGVSGHFTFFHHDPDYLNAGLRHLLLTCWRLQQQRSGSGREVSLHPAVRQTLKLLNDKSCAEDLDALARECNVSPAYLSRTFRREIGVNFSRYRNSLRLGRFWSAYRQPATESILDAVFEAGFGSYAQFFRVFKEAYGQSPRDSLKKINNL